MPKFVFLWTDAFLWGLALVILVYLVFISRRVALRSAWLSVVRTPSAAAAGVILLIFFFIGLLDSIHYRPLLPASNQAQQETQHYAPFVRSTLDEVLGFVGLDAKERSYSAPFARTLFFKETQLIDDEPVRDFPPLVNAAHEITDDVTHRARLLYLLGQTLLWSAVFVGVLRWLLFALVRILQPKPPQRALRDSGTARPSGGVRPVSLWRLPAAVNAVWISLSLIGLVLIAVAVFSPHFYVLGTDRSGNDVIYQAIKSIRTAWVIGTLTTVAMLPPALFFGIAAGYFKGWVDDLIQYLYTTLTSIPGVLLIAACVLMMQVYIDGHPEYFDTVAVRADARLFLLCLILGLTGWSGLCRLLRAETLKLRELDYVQAARAFGLGNLTIMARHILPNVMHIVLITMVLEFSGLVLYEAVLSYLGIGVDPSMASFGTMIDAARLEMSRDPMIWWNLLAAFVFLLALVLAANIFADAVQRAFDPRQRQLAPQPQAS